MKIFQNIDDATQIQNPVLTIGTFDGVHLGHQKILHRLNEEALNINGESVLFTFYPHPRMVLNPTNHGLKLLQTHEEKIEKLRNYNLQNLILFPFTKEFSELSAEEFVKKYLVDILKIKTLIIGYDHQFGKNREGNIEFLKKISSKYNFNVIEIPAHDIDEVNISSTKIREALLKGDIEVANSYLNDSYEIKGIVVEGRKLGRTIGFPTANIEIKEDEKLLPCLGVYFVSILVEGSSQFGMLNIGNNPTISENLKTSIEVHIFDFNEDLYNKSLTIQFIHRIRNEIKFNSLEDLINQLKKDEAVCRNYLSISNL
ncbi:MAG: bifunctional riboflavin kinase/FAD synthetase [Flavobacteriia bacterium]|nr:bifunctional riboflavin kinase/FAD synthetase [Flavobacteriia bacterium]